MLLLKLLQDINLATKLLNYSFSSSPLLPLSTFPLFSSYFSPSFVFFLLLILFLLLTIPHLILLFLLHLVLLLLLFTTSPPSPPPPTSPSPSLFSPPSLYSSSPSSNFSFSFFLPPLESASSMNSATSSKCMAIFVWATSSSFKPLYLIPTGL